MKDIYSPEEIKAMQERIKSLEEALRLALPYVVGAYECAFPDERENEYVKERIEELITPNH